MAWFVKVGDEIYQVENHIVDKLYNEFMKVEDKNKSVDISDKEAVELLDKLLSEYTIRKYIPLDEFEKTLGEKRKLHIKRKIC